MLPEIEYFVDTYIIETNKDNVKTAFGLLEELEIPNYSDAFISIMLNEGNCDSSQLIDNFVITLVEMIDELLKLHGIEVIPEATLEFKNKILRGLIDLPDYSNKDEILGILEQQEEETYKFAELMLHVTDLKIFEIYTKVENINPDIFVKLTDLIKSHANKIPEAELEQQDIRNKIISKLKLIKEFTKYDKAVGFTLVNSNVTLGSDFKQYTQYAQKQFDLLKPEEIAIEAFVLLTMSKEGFEQPLITFRKYSRDLFSDLDMTTKIDIQLNKLIMNLDKYILEKQSKALLPC